MPPQLATATAARDYALRLGPRALRTLGIQQSDRVDNGCRVVFDKDEETGQDLSYIYNKRTKKVIKLRRERNVWILDAVVSADSVETEGFSRQG